MYLFMAFKIFLLVNLKNEKNERIQYVQYRIWYLAFCLPDGITSLALFAIRVNDGCSDNVINCNEQWFKKNFQLEMSSDQTDHTYQLIFFTLQKERNKKY